MRKLLVRIFNLIYLAGSAIAIWAFVTKPIVNTEVGVSFTSDQIADKLMDIFKSKSGEGEGGSGEVESASYRLAYRADAAESVESTITREDIKEAFPNGFSLKIGVKIEAKDAFDINNKQLLKKSIAESIDRSLTSVISSVTDGLHNLIKTLTEKFAKSELTKQINEQIATYFEGASEVTEEQVQAVFDNVYEAISDPNKDVTVDDLAETIVGEKDPETGEYPEGTLLYLLEEKKKETGTGLIYAVADPQPTSENFSEGEYYLKVEGDNPETAETTEEYYYVKAEEWVLGTTYYVQKYDATDVTGDDIADSLAQALDSIPGLVEYREVKTRPTKDEFDATVSSSEHYYSPSLTGGTFVPGGVYSSTTAYVTFTKMDPQPTQEAVEAELALAAANRTIAVKTKSGYEFPSSYESTEEYYEIHSATVTKEQYYNSAESSKFCLKEGEDSYKPAKEYDESATYYIKAVNDVDTALANLISQMLGGGSSSGSEEGGEKSGALYRAHVRAEESSSSSQDELEAAIKEYIYTLLPLDSIYSFTEGADQYATYVALGLIALCIFPWALFALVTFIRTLRKRKCWTKPWIVFVFAFLQVIFGIVLTYGAKYAMPLVTQYIPKAAEFLESTQLGIDIRTGCLIPSFVYCAFIVMTIPYIIICHGVKVEYKLEKRARRMGRY